MTIPTEIGRYKVIGELGRGAMGVVYRGVDPALDRQVAIKVISSQQSAGELNSKEMEARFLREAKIAARINHPGIVTVYDAGRAGDSLYLVMELIEGESLAHRLARKEYPTVPETFMMMAQCGEALAAAHALGVVHRDVKPANIMLTKDGRVKVADFGVAKAIGEGTDLTRTGTVVGSPAYMAPEQVRGLSPDGRADLFSLGVVTYELLLHRKPFPADTITSLIYQILHEDPLVDTDAARSLGERTSNFLRLCLAKDPHDRVPDGNAFAAEARALAAQAASAAAELTGATRLSTAVPAEKTLARPLPAQTVPTAPAAPVKLPLVPLLAGVVIFLAIVVTALLLRQRPPAGGATAAKQGSGGAQPTLQARVEPTQEAISTAPAPPPPDEHPLHLAPQSRPAEPAPTVEVGTAEPHTSRWRPVQQPSLAQLARPAATAPTALPQPTPTPVILQTLECRAGATFDITPAKADVVINGRLIGIASDWNGSFLGLAGKTYVFPGPGVYYARFSYPDRKSVWVKVVVTPNAKKRVAKVEARLPTLGE